MYKRGEIILIELRSTKKLCFYQFHIKFVFFRIFQIDIEISISEEPLSLPNLTSENESQYSPKNEAKRERVNTKSTYSECE